MAMTTSPSDTIPGPDVDHELVRRARALHEHACEHVDAATLAKLAAARREALAKHHRPRRAIWLPAAGAAAACALVIGLVWFKPQPDSPTVAPTQVAGTGDAELPPDADVRQLELYQNLDFYQWLAQQPQTHTRANGGRQ
jgi:ferric-dicitrate binding protein FerR (iron transport regulator)